MNLSDIEPIYLLFFLLIPLIKLVFWLPLYNKSIIKINFFASFFRFYKNVDFAEESRRRAFTFMGVNNWMNIIFWIFIALAIVALVFDNQLWKP